jgi:hypothetical protein
MERVSVQPNQVNQITISEESMALIQKAQFEMDGALSLLKEFAAERTKDPEFYDYLYEKYIRCRMEYNLAVQTVSKRYNIYTAGNMNFNFLNNEVSWQDD